MSGGLFDTHIVVDWSARSTPSPKRPTRDAIWWAVQRDGVAEPPVYVRTRAEAVARLIALLSDERRAGRRVLIGFDFPFGYPEGVAARITGRDHAYALWDWIAARVGDGPDNTNRRFDAAEAMNAAYDGIGPMWGRPESWDHPGVPVKMAERRGADHPPERRHAEARSATAKTVWQLAYAGSVGSQVLLGVPALKALREAPALRDHLAVWPFDSGLRVPEAQIVLAEIYPSLLQAEMHRRRGADEVVDAAQVRTLAAAFAALDAQGGLDALFEGPVDLYEAERAAVCREEGWILGLGEEDSLRDALGAAAVASGGGTSGQWTGAGFDYLKHGPEIYAQSFATVRAETDVSRFSPELAEVAIRVVHACGMVEVARDLVFGGDPARAAAAALDAGAPVFCDCTMVASGIIRRGLPRNNAVLVTLNDARVPDLARELGTTRSAAAVELWRDRLEGAVVAIGNAPTALFHLLEMMAAGGPKPAAIFGFPVGFVGAAESKAALAAGAHGVPFLALPGRRGGSAMAAAAVNGATLGLRGDGT